MATARYEMLHLTEEQHKLGPPLSGAGVREFLVPTQLHELFCWVHHLKPLDLFGKPWANYHLEMQLLQVVKQQAHFGVKYNISVAGCSEAGEKRPQHNVLQPQSSSGPGPGQISSSPKLQRSGQWGDNDLKQ